MFAPEEETVANIKAWLIGYGIHDSRVIHSENKGWIAVDVTVEEAESLLLAEFHERNPFANQPAAVREKSKRATRTRPLA